MVLAAKSFGKFREEFLSDIHTEIVAHAQQEPVTHTGSGPRPVFGMTVHDSDVLEPEPVRRGGLMQTGIVSGSRSSKQVFLSLYLLSRITPSALQQSP